MSSGGREKKVVAGESLEDKWHYVNSFSDSLSFLDEGVWMQSTA